MSEPVVAARHNARTIDAKGSWKESADSWPVPPDADESGKADIRRLADLRREREEYSENSAGYF